MNAIAVLCHRRSGSSFQFATSEAAIETLERLGYVRTKSKPRQHEAGRYANTSAVAIVYTSGSVVAAGERAGRLVYQLAGLSGEPIQQLYVAVRSPQHLAEYQWCSHPSQLAAHLETLDWQHWRKAEQETDPAGHKPAWILCAPGHDRPFSAIKCSHAGVLKMLGDDWQAWAEIEPFVYYTEGTS